MRNDDRNFGNGGFPNSDLSPFSWLYLEPFSHSSGSVEKLRSAQQESLAFNIASSVPN